MSERYQKKIRKEISARYRRMSAKAELLGWFQRLKISMKYLFTAKLDLWGD